MEKIRSWLSLVGLALCTLWMRRKQTFLLVVLIALLLTVLQTLLAQYGASEYAVYEMKKIWKVNEEKTYHLGMAYVTPEDVEYSERLVAYLEEAREIEQIECLGKYFWTGIQIDGKELNCLHIDPELLAFAGIEPEGSGAAEGVYLGADFIDQYQVGDVFWGEYIVEGFLPKGMKWPTSARLLTGTEVALELDEHLLFIEPEDKDYGLYDGLLFNQCIYFTLKEDADIEQVEQELLSLASRYNVGAYVESLEELYDEYISGNDLLRGKYRQQIILALLVSVLTITTAHLISFWVLRSFYGVLYACGYTQNNMLFKLAIENLLLFVFAAGVSYALTSIYIVPEMAGERYWFEAWRTLAVGQTLGIACGIWLMSMIMPAIYVYRQMPWNLLKEK